MNLQDKLSNLPKTPGVYFYKDKSGEIIYVGKAAVLRNRVRQYFQKSRAFDAKTDALVAEIADIDWMELETEMDALFVEAEMIRRYMPKYNILLRDDKSFVYVRIDINSSYPSVTFTRRPLDDGAKYYGPFLSKYSIAKALKYLRKIFPYSTHAKTNIPKRACLQAQIGLCPGLEAGMTSLSDYKKNLNMLIKYMTGKRRKLVSDMEKQMFEEAKNKNYETAAVLRNKIFALRKLDTTVVFGDRENMDISKDHGLVELAKLIGINPPKKIEGFDISHMQGSDTVASMVVFIAGVPVKSEYRKFKSRIKGNDDFAHMREAMSRRFSETNVKKWNKPDLILIDGGKGQVSSALTILNTLSIKIPLIGLAKRYEEIILPKNGKFEKIILPKTSDALKLLQRIRDESHRFALSYHTSLKRSRQRTSVLDEVPGIGPAYKKKLIKSFGSARGVKQASLDQLTVVVGKKKAQAIKEAVG